MLRTSDYPYFTPNLVASAFGNPLGSPFGELFGRLCLTHADVAQRLQYLTCRLSMGVTESCVRSHLLKHDDSFYMAHQAELEERIALMLEAGVEGWVTILRGYIEDVTQAQIRCVEAVFRESVGESARALLPFKPGLGVPAGLRRAAKVSAAG